MSAGTLTESDAKASSGGFRLGAFLLGRRIDDGSFGRRAAVTAEAVGVTGTVHEGRTGVVRCTPMTTASAETVALAEQTAAKLLGVRHPAIVPLLEAGVAGEVAYVVEAKLAGTAIAEVLSRHVKVPPTEVKRLVADLAAGLTVLHVAGLAHGRVTPAAVWQTETGGAVLGGFTLGSAPAGDSDPWTPAENVSAPATAATDQYQLAMTAAAALTGAAPTAAGGVGDHLPGVPGVVVSVLSRATAANPEARYPSIDAFAQAFAESIGRAGDDLVAGVWEAISRRDDGMASLMLEMAQAFAPDHPDLSMLRMRMSGGAATAGTLAMMGSLLPATPPALAMPAAPVFEPPISPLPASNEAAIAALLTPPQPTTVVEKKNPWVPFAVGSFICFVFFVIIAVVMVMLA